MKKLLNFLLIPLAFIGLIALITLPMRLVENQSASFATYAELEASGIIERGWLPSFLPRSATAIEESHDLDTNRVWASFSFKAGDDVGARENCKVVAKTNAGTKFLCPPYEKSTSTLILRSNGSGSYLRYENGI